MRWSLRTIVCETTGLEDYAAQLGDAAATSVVEVNKRKTGPGHRILQKREHRRRRQAMLAAQMQKSTDNAVAAVSVVITPQPEIARLGPSRMSQNGMLVRFIPDRQASPNLSVTDVEYIGVWAKALGNRRRLQRFSFCIPNRRARGSAGG
jgi:hypothetical protein